ncbi:hypothetical protein D3C80_1653920 [compost metagenome]
MVTNSTGRTPGRVNTVLSPRRRSIGWPSKSGTFAITQTTSTRVKPLMRPKHALHPRRVPRKVPAGMPSDSASGVPTMATAIARPFSASGTMRAA